MKIRVDKTEYYFSHAKAPRGYGTWVFKIAGNYYFLTELFSKAVRGAVRIAREIGADKIIVMP